MVYRSTVMTLYFISVVVMWSGLSSGNHGHDVSASTNTLQCENCQCEGITGEKCPFQECQKFWDDCILKKFGETTLMDEYYKQIELERENLNLNLNFSNPNYDEFMKAFTAYANKQYQENFMVDGSKNIETTTEFQFFSTPSREKEQLTLKFKTNQPFKESNESVGKKIKHNQSKLDNKTYKRKTVHKRDNLVLVADVGIVVWICVIILCVYMYLRRSVSAIREDTVSNRIRIDNDGNTTKIIHKDNAVLLNVNSNDVEFVPIREPLLSSPINGQNITRTITV